MSDETELYLQRAENELIAAQILFTISDIKKQLPKKIMHETLKVVLEYLWKSGKILYGPKGIQWIYSEPEHLRTMLEHTLEV